MINRAYCDNVCASSTLRCLHGGYPNPRDCAACLCPAGLRGDCSLPSVSSHRQCEGGALQARENFQLLRSMPLLPDQSCYWLIKVGETARPLPSRGVHFASQSRRVPDAE